LLQHHTDGHLSKSDSVLRGRGRTDGVEDRHGERLGGLHTTGAARNATAAAPVVLCCCIVTAPSAPTMGRVSAPAHRRIRWAGGRQGLA